jgi:DNA repair exonuclease SbcCD ATPase subunit
MKITSMTVENFLSFGKAEFNFEDAGLVLVEGENQDDESAKSNGSGKSAMIDALVWCLFGTTLRGYENDEVIHRKVGKDCLVMVDLHDGKSAYRVSRARRHTRWKNTLTVSTNGTDASGPNTAETQEVAEKLLGCTRRTFLSSVVFGQDRAYRFSSLTDKEQKEILDEVLGVERFAQACSLARSRKSSLEAATALVRDGLERATEERDAAKEETDDLRKKDSTFESERKVRREKEHEGLRKAKGWAKKNAKIDATKLKTTADKAQLDVTSFMKARDIANAAVTEAKVLRAGAKAKVDELRAHVKRHESITGDCPTCGQRVDDMQRERVVGDFKKKLAPAVKALEKVDAAVAEIEQQLVAASRDLSAANQVVLAAQKALNEGIGAGANAKSWQQRAEDHEKRIAEIGGEKNPYAQLAEKAEARCAKRQKEIDLLMHQLEADEAQVKQAEFWVEAFGTRGLRSLLLDNSLPLLNEEAARVSRAVTGGAITIDFSATSELKSGKTIDRFEVKVDNKHGAGSYFGNSAGERAKVDLCVGLALQRLVASRATAAFNVVFMDEVFDHLDSAAHERVVEVLSELDKASVFVVSHEEDLKAWFPHTLRVVKKGGFSRVEE